MSLSEDIISKAVTSATSFFHLAKQSVVYRASIAYVLQHVKAFIAAANQMKDKELTPSEKQAFQRFIGLIMHFSNILPLLGEKWLSSILNWPSTHMHNYIDGFRKAMIEICQQLSLDVHQIVNYNKQQDKVNRNADFQHLQEALMSVRESNISIPNAIDVQQLIETRLRSVKRHLPKTKKEPKVTEQPSSDAVPIAELHKKMDQELSVFRSIDIPCEDLRCDHSLGAGGFGTVFKATRLSTAELLAVKEVRSDKLTMATWASLYSEVATMAELRHRYVLELVGAHVQEPYRIITRFCPGKSVFDRLHRSSHPLTPHQLTAIAYQVAEGMRFLHENGIVHRDLKTMNILLDDYNIAKIADFGLAGMMKDGQDLKGGVGTPHYTAPEVLERRRYGPKVDIYSFGVILWEMANCQIPFRDKTHQEILEHVVTNNRRLPQGPNCPDPLWKLINRCWQANPNDRPEFSEIAELFLTGQVYFHGCERSSESTLEIQEGCPPLDIEYLLSVLEDPKHTQFASIVQFLVTHIDRKIRSLLRKKEIMAKYSSQSEHQSSILLLASEVLKQDEFPGFINSMGKEAIQNIINANDAYDLRAAIAFCLKVPDKCFNLVKCYISSFVEKMNVPMAGSLVVQLISRLSLEEAAKFKDNLIMYFDPTGISSVNDQETLNAVATVFPLISQDIDGFQLVQFIPLIELPLDVPVKLIHMLIEKVGAHSPSRMIMAVMKATLRVDVCECLIKLLNMCTDSDLDVFSKEFEIFNVIQKLVTERKSVKTALLMLFRLSMVPCIAPLLANHPLLHSILQTKKHVAQRLQIFTALFSNEQFCSDTTVSDGVWKLLVSSMNREKYSNYALKLIGALSCHQTGRNLIIETGLLTLFTQMFLSTTSGDPSISLTILSNMTQETDVYIPQLSLIISCLTQDLVCTGANKCDILKTLIDLINVSPTCIQEHDLRNSVLPLLSTREEPVIIVLAMKLFDRCDMIKLRSIYNSVAQRVYNILSSDDLLYPEVLEAAVDLIASLAATFNMRYFLVETQFIQFIEGILEQLKSFEAAQTISKCLFLLERTLKEDNPPEEEDRHNV